MYIDKCYFRNKYKRKIKYLKLSMVYLEKKLKDDSIDTFGFIATKAESLSFVLN